MLGRGLVEAAAVGRGTVLKGEAVLEFGLSIFALFLHLVFVMESEKLHPLNSPKHILSQESFFDLHPPLELENLLGVAVFHILHFVCHCLHLLFHFFLQL